MWKLAFLNLGLISHNRALLAGRKMTDRGRPDAAAAVVRSPREVKDMARLSAAKSWQLAESMRQRLVPDTAFPDPAWKLFLWLYVARKEGRLCSVAQACEATGLAQATALRWVRALAAEGSVAVNQTLPLDARIDLTARKIIEIDELMDLMRDAAAQPVMAA